MRTPVKEQQYKLYRWVIVWFLLTALALCSLVMIRKILLENAQKMGNEMAHSYSVDGEKDIVIYETLMQVSTKYIGDQLERSENPAGWIKTYLQTVADTLGANIIDPYAVIDGEIAAANPWAGDETYDAKETEWYQKAIAAEGSVIYTDGYTDAITGEMVVTIAQAIPGTDNVVAFDIFPKYFLRSAAYDDMPEKSSYLLGDSRGTLLYAQSPSHVTQENFTMILDMIRQGAFQDFNSYVTNADGERLSVYYDIASNGWISIVAIPQQVLLQGVYELSNLYIVILTLFFVVMIIMSLREKKANKMYRHTNDTMRALGNSYYAIYRVNYAQNMYDMIKGSDYVRQRIPAQGDYDQLIHTAGEVIEKNAFEDFCISFSSEHIRDLVSKRVRNYGGDFLRKFGDEYRWVDVRLLFDESLNPEEVILCFREVNDEKKEQLGQMRLLRESLEAAKESEKSKNDFFSNMSHDMRTPLNAILGMLELCEKYAEDPKRVKEYVGKLRYSARQLLGLINDILEMSRMQNGRLTLENKHFNLRRCMEDCMSQFIPQIEQEGKICRTSYTMLHTEVYGDEFRLTQILNNLLSNAVKFTEAGDEISLSVFEVNQQEYAKYQIVVKDTGIGMSQEFLQKVFEPYERETRFSARSISGTGLGMAITKNIITQMNGEISVESQLGEGSTFTVTLPFQRVYGAEEEEEKKTECREDFLEGKTILVAEDNEINMEVAEEFLTMFGAKVLQAWNGREAVEIFASSKESEIQVILMDMQMPEMDGCTAARTIRNLHRSDAKIVPIIAVTANAFAEDLAATKAAGMDGHISKPIDFRILSEQLQQIVMQKRHTDEDPM